MNCNTSILILTALFMAWLKLSDSRPRVECRDPDLGGTAQNADRKFMVLGSNDGGGAGLGNMLIFFPAAFYFAAVTGRDIVITDHSIVGEMCHIIHCGFPFVSQLSLAFPKILNHETIAQSPELKALDFQAHMEGRQKVTAPVVRAGGYMSKSDWWVWYNRTVSCVSKITGCDLADVMCAERHAYQRLIRGPFRHGLTGDEEQRIVGVPDHIKHAILALPHQYAPRLDAAIHLRTQFNNFEAEASSDSKAYKKEVGDWMNSTEKRMVFKAMRKKVTEVVQHIRPQQFNVSDDGQIARVSTKEEAEPVYIYLASDNAEVKDLLYERLTTHPLLIDLVYIMKVNTKFVHHVKNLQKLKHATNNEGLLDLVFDWYALSLANKVFAWRKGSTGMVSSFVHSAQKVSGNTERTDNQLGRGIGTRGYQLTLDPWGNPKFDLFWVYTFIEDYQLHERL